MLFKRKIFNFQKIKFKISPKQFYIYIINYKKDNAIFINTNYHLLIRISPVIFLVMFAIIIKSNKKTNKMNYCKMIAIIKINKILRIVNAYKN